MQQKLCLLMNFILFLCCSTLLADTVEPGSWQDIKDNKTEFIIGFACTTVIPAVFVAGISFVAWKFARPKLKSLWNNVIQSRVMSKIFTLAQMYPKTTVGLGISATGLMGLWCKRRQCASGMINVGKILSLISIINSDESTD
jgi:hypothetical protein